MPKTRLQDQTQTYAPIWSPEYWRSAARRFSNLPILIMCAIFIALYIVINFMQVPLPGDLKLKFTFIPQAFIGLIGGPLIAIPAGILCDILSIITFPSGGYFPLFTVTSILQTLVYALVFYRAKISLVRIIVAISTVNLAVNLLFNSWVRMLYFGKNTYWFFFVPSAFKNAITIPIYVIILYLLFSALMLVMAKLKMIPAPTKKYIPII